MISIHREPLFQVAMDIDDLIVMNHAETGARNGLTLCPDWSRYKALEESGSLVITTARDGEKLVGYSVDLLSKHPHYSTEVMGINDLTYLHPDYRKGSNGVRLIREAEKILKSLGVTYVTRSAKDQTALAALLPHMKYEREETVFGKRI